MPISEKQLKANRRNAQRSTGPKTPEGKSRAALNNFRHGLTGQTTVLTAEDRELHDAFCRDLIADLDPETLLERQLAQFIAEDSWRLSRISAIDANIFALGRGGDRGPVRNALADAQSFLDHAREFNLLSLYEQRIHRNMQRNIDQLRELRAEREERKEREERDTRKAEPRPQAEPTKIQAGPPAHPVEPAQFPAPNGFEFSNAPINHLPDHDNRMKQPLSAVAAA